MNRRAALALLVAITFSAFLFPVVAEAPHAELWYVSLPALHIAAGERIVGFHIEVTSGRIAQVPDMPIGWNASVDNDPSWNTKIDASLIVAAAALNSSFFRDFIVLEKEPGSDNSFDLSGEIIVSKDFSSTRTIHVGMKDFRLKEKTASSQRAR
jgi:hypothetical protein